LAREHLMRRLVAVFAADVAGYSRLTGADEEGTHVRLRQHLRELFTPNIAAHFGTVVKNTGDGLLAEFDSVVDAVRCAVDVQHGMAERNATVPPNDHIEFRIGINVGDIIKDDGDIFGDAVNVAVRLETIAEPGGICLSDDAHRYVLGKLDIAFDDAGEQRLKNIERPVRVFTVGERGIAASERSCLVPPDKPSIAVLPFENMSGDPEQEYFADGMVEEITTALSRFKTLFVIARNSSFTYKRRAVDVKQVGRELGVRYVLEGSVRKAASRVRITGELVDTATGVQLWADRFEGGLEDVFDLQDKVTESVVGAIAPQLQQAEIERARRKLTESLDAYDLFLRGMAREVANLAGGLEQPTSEGTSEALKLFYGVIKLDPGFASAYGMAALCHAQRKAFGWISDREQEIAEAERLARKAIQLGKDDAVALATGGYVLAFVVHDLESGAAAVERALMLNPNFAAAWLFLGWIKVWQGEPDVAIDRLERAIRLSPLGRGIAGMQAAVATAHFFAGRHDDASAWAGKLLREYPASHPGLRIAAASNAAAGRTSEAMKAVTRLRQLDPALRVSNFGNVLGPYSPQARSKYEEAMRQAGLE
jgi:TolB-like protein/class 3 adenylate cyclase/tetratricopeptide (TPR) repeat protein